MINLTKDGLITKAIKAPETSSEAFDDSKDLLDEGENLNNLINYRISWITITYDKSLELIVGIQLTFRDLKKKELIPIIRRVGGNNYNYGEGERIRLKNGEYLCDLSYYLNEKGITQVYLETNKHSKYEIGKNIGEKIELLPKSKKKLNIILGTFGTMTNLGIFYIDTSDYIKKFLTGLSELRLKLENDKLYRKEAEEKYKDLSLIDKYIYRMVLLPKTPFANILKYILSEIK